MGRKIHDEFAGQPGLSKQRRYQLRKLRDGKCQGCGREATGNFCEPCRLQRNIVSRESNRRRFGSRKRLLNAESYLFEAELKRLKGKRRGNGKI